MTQLALATGAFLLTHFVSSTPLRPALVRALGQRSYIGLYSLVAFGTLGWMIWAYAGAPREPLWNGWRLLPLIAMPFAFMLIVPGYWRNPMMVGADKLLKSAEPARGMTRITRHPIMWGLVLWSLSHVLARGDVRSVIFFGSFFVLAALGTVMMDGRKATKMGEDWKAFAAATSNIPFVAIAQGRNRIVWREIGWLRPAIALALFAVVFAAHGWVFGVRPY